MNTNSPSTSREVSVLSRQSLRPVINCLYREGVDLEHSTLADWVGQSSQLFRPLINTLNRYVMSGHKVQADDTPIDALAAGSGKTKTARLWTYVRDDRPAAYTTPAGVWFAYSSDRKGQQPRAHLKNFSGILQADGYTGFAQLYRSGSVQEAACWTHARRKFYDAYKDQSSLLAAEMLQRIAPLYVIVDVTGRDNPLRTIPARLNYCY